jgi:hypothetical protein
VKLKGLAELMLVYFPCFATETTAKPPVSRRGDVEAEEAVVEAGAPAEGKRAEPSLRTPNRRRKLLPLTGPPRS